MAQTSLVALFQQLDGVHSNLHTLRVVYHMASEVMNKRVVRLRDGTRAMRL